jgi:hypothetical protein
MPQLRTRNPCLPGGRSRPLKKGHGKEHRAHRRGPRKNTELTEEGHGRTLSSLKRATEEHWSSLKRATEEH